MIGSHRFNLNRLQGSRRRVKTRSNTIEHDSSATVQPQSLAESETVAITDPDVFNRQNFHNGFAYRPSD